MIDNMISRDEGHQGLSLVPSMVHPSLAHQTACLVLSTSCPLWAQAPLFTALGGLTGQGARTLPIKTS